MKALYGDRRFQLILAANILSSIGSGITMIGVPWLLITQVNGGALFGYITIIMTVVNFLVTPAIGHLVDRVSRKKVLLVGEGIGFTIILMFSLYGMIGFQYEVWHYIFLYGTGALYYTLFYPTIFAFNQEIFQRSVYRSLNGAMEIQGQFSSVLAGALATTLITWVDLHWLLLLDAFTYLAAFLLFLPIPYTKEVKEPTMTTFYHKISEGYRFMKNKPALFLFLLVAFMPFIGVMVTNYLFPVYLAEVLKTSASAYGLQSMIYGIGAVIAGVIIPAIANRWGNKRSIVGTVGIYTVAILCISASQSTIVFLSLSLLLAFGNAGTRVARNSYMMDVVPNSIMGRVDSLFRAIGLGKRILILSMFTQFTASHNISNSFYALSLIMILSMIIIVLTYKKISKKSYANALQG